jgi:hypothetical protein
MIAPTVGQGAPPDCRKHIELHGGKYWAKELGKSEMWVLANHHINLWQSQSPTKGNRVGQMRVGSRAMILEEAADDYKVRSPLDGAQGWVGKIQVGRTLWQDAKTFKPCPAPK